MLSWNYYFLKEAEAGKYHWRLPIWWREETAYPYLLVEGWGILAPETECGPWHTLSGQWDSPQVTPLTVLLYPLFKHFCLSGMSSSTVIISLSCLDGEKYVCLYVETYDYCMEYCLLYTGKSDTHCSTHFLPLDLPMNCLRLHPLLAFGSWKVAHPCHGVICLFKIALCKLLFCLQSERTCIFYLMGWESGWFWAVKRQQED